MVGSAHPDAVQVLCTEEHISQPAVALPKRYGRFAHTEEPMEVYL